MGGSRARLGGWAGWGGRWDGDEGGTAVEMTPPRLCPFLAAPKMTSGPSGREIKASGLKGAVESLVSRGLFDLAEAN